MSNSDSKLPDCSPDNNNDTDLKMPSETASDYHLLACFDLSPMNSKEIADNPVAYNPYNVCFCFHFWCFD